jgi:hypothetical protein
VNHHTDDTPGLPTTPEQQTAAKKVLDGWSCCCSSGCDCFAYRQLLTLCIKGKPLFKSQQSILSRLLKRGGL